MLPQGGRLTPSAAFEPLERRDHFAATPKTDPAYHATADALHKAAGDNVNLYPAVAGPGDRTYVLAERYDDDGYRAQKTHGLLTIAAYGADGKLDPSFGTAGVALTGRTTLDHDWAERPGLLKVDGRGRLYFADNTRVLRFHPDGSTDGSFGTKGAVTFSTADEPVGLCDIQPVDDGVLIATTDTVKGVQHFVVQKASKTVRTVWQATHDTGVKKAARSGTTRYSSESVAEEALADDAARFATSRGGVVLARIETDNETYIQPDPTDDFGGPFETFGEKAQRLAVTRFDAAGKGTDLLRVALRRPGEHLGTALADPENTPDDLTNATAPVLSPSGRTLTLQTTNEIVQVDLKGGLVGRISNGNAAFDTQRSPVVATFQPTLLPDGSVWVQSTTADKNYKSYYAVRRFVPDFVHGTAKADGRALTLASSDLAPSDRVLGSVEPFLGASGRLYVYTRGDADNIDQATLAISRI